MDKPCRIPIFSSGTGGESAALTARRIIQRCDHPAAAESGRIRFRVIELLDRAEALLEAASRCLQATGKMAEAEELLLSAVTAADEAEKLAQALSREEDSNRLVVAAFEVLPEGSELGCPPTEVQVEALIVNASAHADEAQQLADDLPVKNSDDVLQVRIDQVRARVTDLSSQLGQGGNANGSSSA
ncbi:hypothetical protein [Streptomyces antibioticus]|uniref:hypothetical protein n=1 Tax=Streptomyces antibioticus TaxID=1890 RepID=UPI0033EF5D4B